MASSRLLNTLGFNSSPQSHLNTCHDSQLFSQRVCCLLHRGQPIWKCSLILLPFSSATHYAILTDQRDTNHPSTRLTLTRFGSYALTAAMISSALTKCSSKGRLRSSNAVHEMTGSAAGPETISKIRVGGKSFTRHGLGVALSSLTSSSSRSRSPTPARGRYARPTELRRGGSC